MYKRSPCKSCGQQFQPLRERHKFCSQICSIRYLNRPGPTHPRWSGGHLNKDGYRQISIGCYQKNNWDILLPMAIKTPRGEYRITEHRAVMALHIGRALQKQETVHHKNGNRADNRLENLELRVSQHGPGATAAALTCPHCGKRYDAPATR